MVRFQFSYPDGATPIDLDEARDLIPDYISTMGELNQLEQANIARGFLWADKQDLANLLTVTFPFRVHHEMFKDVWKWAGKVRKTQPSPAN